jgi:hypothetical protein
MSQQTYSKDESHVRKEKIIRKLNKKSHKQKHQANIIKQTNTVAAKIIKCLF